jgi:hypothetical protein
VAYFLLDQYCRDKTFIVVLMFGKLLFNLLPKTFRQGEMTLRSSFEAIFSPYIVLIYFGCTHREESTHLGTNFLAGT